MGKKIIIIFCILYFFIGSINSWETLNNLNNKFFKNKLIEKVTNKIITYEMTSDSLVYGRILNDYFNINNNKFLQGKNIELISLENKINQNSLNEYFFHKKELSQSLYTPQFGFQGNIYSFIYKKLNIKNINFLYNINTLLLVIMIFFFLNYILLELGTFSMVLAGLSLVLYPTLLLISKSMYWIIWITYLPMVATMYLIKSNRGIKWYFYSSFVLVLLKCLCGYELISTILVNMELPIIYYGLKNYKERKENIKKVIFSFLGGILGFVVAVLSHLLRLYKLTNNFQKAKFLFLSPIKYRTNLFYDIEFLNKIQPELKESLDISNIKIIVKYLLEPRPIPIILILIIYIYISLQDLKKKKNIDIIFIIYLSLLGVFSWLILAKGHSYTTLHIVYLLWNIPFLFLTFAYFGKKIEEFFIIRRRVK